MDSDLPPIPMDDKQVKHAFQQLKQTPSKAWRSGSRRWASKAGDQAIDLGVDAASTPAATYVATAIGGAVAGPPGAALGYASGYGVSKLADQAGDKIKGAIPHDPNGFEDVIEKVRAELQQDLYDRTQAPSAPSQQAPAMQGRMAYDTLTDHLQRMRALNTADRQLSNATVLREQLMILAQHEEGSLASLQSHQELFLSLSYDQIMLLAGYDRAQHARPRMWDTDTDKLNMPFGPELREIPITSIDDLVELAERERSAQAEFEQQAERIKQQMHEEGVADEIERFNQPRLEAIRLINQRVEDDLADFVNKAKLDDNVDRQARVSQQLQAWRRYPSVENLRQLRETMTREARQAFEQAMQGGLERALQQRWHLADEIQSYKEHISPLHDEHAKAVSDLEESQRAEAAYRKLAKAISMINPDDPAKQTAMLSLIARTQKPADLHALGPIISELRESYRLGVSSSRVHGTALLTSGPRYAPSQRDIASALDQLQDAGLIKQAEGQSSSSHPHGWALTTQGRELVTDIPFGSLHPSDLAAWSMQQGLLSEKQMLAGEPLAYEALVVGQGVGRRGLIKSKGAQALRDAWETHQQSGVSLNDLQRPELQQLDVPLASQGHSVSKRDHGIDR